MSASRAGAGEYKELEPHVNAESKESLKHKEMGAGQRDKGTNMKGLPVTKARTSRTTNTVSF